MPGVPRWPRSPGLAAVHPAEKVEACLGLKRVRPCAKLSPSAGGRAVSVVVSDRGRGIRFAARACTFTAFADHSRTAHTGAGTRTRRPCPWRSTRRPASPSVSVTTATARTCSRFPARPPRSSSSSSRNGLRPSCRSREASSGTRSLTSTPTRRAVVAPAPPGMRSPRPRGPSGQRPERAAERQDPRRGPAAQGVAGAGGGGRAGNRRRARLVYPACCRPVRATAAATATPKNSTSASVTSKRCDATACTCGLFCARAPSL